MDKLDKVTTAISNGTIQQLDASLQTSRERELNARLLQRDLLENLWLLMARLFGHKWTSNFGDQVDPGNVWAACLRGISAEQIRSGMAELVKTGSEWPPSAPEFRRLCTGESDTAWEHRNQSRSVREALGHEMYALEDQGKKERARAAGEVEMRKIKSLFGD